jgi:hypothetical protein
MECIILILKLSQLHSSVSSLWERELSFQGNANGVVQADPTGNVWWERR